MEILLNTKVVVAERPWTHCIDVVAVVEAIVVEVVTGGRYQEGRLVESV